jgi:transcriptional regulator with XRE-family HTH domain
MEEANMNFERLSTEEKAAQLLKMVQTGEYLKELRNSTGKSLKEVCDQLSLSTTYLSEIERGLKSPSDFLIRELAEFYNIDENTIYDKLGRVPLAVMEELKENINLKNMILSIRNNSNITDDRKYEIYENLYRVYKSMLHE